MTNGAAFDEPARYQIRVKGRLDQTWSAWFEGLEIIAHVNQETILAGWVADQAALHGLLAKIHNLGLPLLAVLRERENTSE
jgi:hypothetical protein